jgi:uncharacterized protein YjdB
LVIGVARGIAKIIVITEDGQFSDTCEVTVTFVTDIEQSVKQSEASKTKVYPTVTAGIIHIVLSEKTTETAVIMDIYGKVLQTVHLQSMESTIDITSCKSGLYLIRIGHQVVKIIKL